MHRNNSMSIAQKKRGGGSQEIKNSLSLERKEMTPVSSTEAIMVKWLGGLQFRADVFKFHFLHDSTASLLLNSVPGWILNLGAVLPPLSLSPSSSTSERVSVISPCEECVSGEFWSTFIAVKSELLPWFGSITRTQTRMLPSFVNW